ncbi:MAG: histidine--tRNA ligase [Bacteroidia bacterium]|nr:histidine--tRNA ligase [Bacteroidia bacterium]
MSSQKPSIPKGTRDFLPQQMVKREYIINIIRSVFQKYGFQPLETPAMENLSTLGGKYGDEGDQLMFKVLNSGDYLSKVPDGVSENGSKEFTQHISEKALRYDLTVPLARVVAMYQNDIVFPFRRYQIQPVWRADRPQKGRFREFYQCDVDVVGSESLLVDAELIKIIDEVFSSLKLNDFTIKVNNRKVLSGIAEVVGEKGKEVDICVAIDKLDKVGLDGVNEELSKKDLSADAIQKINEFLNIKEENYLQALEKLIQSSDVGKEGVEELGILIDHVNKMKLTNAKLTVTTTLARGLNYYTGTIFEAVINNASMGSVCGGGRYDNLIGMFGKQEIPAVGFSFGLDRIYEVIDELNLFPDNFESATKLMFANFDEDLLKDLLPMLIKVREAGINAEVYPVAAKLKKQMSYADSKQIPFVALVGSNELESGKLTLKNMTEGSQEELTIDEIIEKIK